MALAHRHAAMDGCQDAAKASGAPPAPHLKAEAAPTLVFMPLSPIASLKHSLLPSITDMPRLSR